MNETTQLTVFWLLLIASVVAMSVRYIKVPYTVALVLCGWAIGQLGLLPQVHLEPQILFAVFLPPLIFEAGIHIKIQQLKQNALVIGMLAVIGTIISSGIIGYIVHHWLGLSLAIALLFGAIISPTDPISVIALFKRLGVPNRLAMIVEGESLFNDGIAVVLFGLLLQIATTSELLLLGGLLQVVTTIAGGVVIGAVIGAGGSAVTRQFDDHLLEITLTTIVAYGSYLAAEAIHVSGVIAVVTASLVVGNVGMKHGMSPNSRLAVLAFWEYAAFVVNSLVFLIVGIEEAAVSFAAAGLTLLVAGGAALLARAVIVYGIWTVAMTCEPGMGRWSHAVFWSGLRGGLSMAMALGVPLFLPEREELIVMTYGVVLSSLLVQGLTVEGIIKKLGLTSARQGERYYQQLLGENMSIHAACAELEKTAAQGLLTTGIVEQERTRLRNRQQELEKELAQIHVHQGHIAAAETKKARLISLMAQRNALKDAEASGIVTTEAAAEIIARLEEEYEEQTRQ